MTQNDVSGDLERETPTEQDFTDGGTEGAPPDGHSTDDENENVPGAPPTEEQLTAISQDIASWCPGTSANMVNKVMTDAGSINP